MQSSQLRKGKKVYFFLNIFVSEYEIGNIKFIWTHIRHEAHLMTTQRHVETEILPNLYFNTINKLMTIIHCNVTYSC